jgi:hypothetical protein
MKNLSSFFEDNNGGLSATRLAFLLWAVGVLAVWIYSSIKNATLQPVDNSITTILGILMTGKVVQRFGEKPDSASVDSAGQNDKVKKSLETIPPHQ